MSAAIEFQDFSFTYQGALKPALSGIELRIDRGALVVVMGATGAGKTTLARCVNRTIPCFHPGTIQGSLSLWGERLRDETVGDLAGRVGLVSQDFESQLFATNVTQEIAFGMEQLGVDPAEMRLRLAEALRTVGLSGFESRDPATLSGGEKQRLAIAATLAMQPQILVFDEPTTDLDPLGKLEVFRVLAAMRARGDTLVLIEHETQAAALADRLVILHQGQIVADDTPATILRDVAFLETHGIRSPDLSRLAQRMRWTSVPASEEVAATHLRDLPRRALGPATPTVTGEPIVVSEEAEYRYAAGFGGESRIALQRASLTISRGEFVALIGQNGSGKTTLAKMLNGLLVPTQGRVLLGGEDIRRVPLSTVATKIGYVFQDPDHQIFAASVFDEVAFGPRNLGVPDAEIAERVAEVLAIVGLAGAEHDDPFLLSKGHRQRLAVASMLALRPSLLILDEPTTGLDYHEQRQMMQLIADLRRRGMTFVIITHSPWVVAEYAERGILLRQGRIVFDGPLRDLFAEEDLLASTHFRLPEATRIGRQLGFTPLSVDELADAFAESPLA